MTKIAIVEGTEDEFVTVRCAHEDARRNRAHKVRANIHKSYRARNASAFPEHAQRVYRAPVRPNHQETTMPRYILIERNSGYIWGDTAAFAVDPETLTPEEASRLIDEDNLEYGFTYETYQRAPDGIGGYFVYRADRDGIDLVPLVDDGQNQDEIAAVERLCEYVCFVVATRPEND